MSETEPIVQCSNPHCLAANALKSRLCYRCKTPVVKRYLWATAEAVEENQVGGLIDDRYFALTTRILLDTQPGNPPQTKEEIPEQIIAYLQLFSFSPHIPQVYSRLNNTDIWLLEHSTVPLSKVGKLQYFPELMPSITAVWQQKKALRQLNWLRQLARLWQPLKQKKVVSSLLNPQLIRINGPVVQLLQLAQDKGQSPSLKQLGKLWYQWSETAAPTIQELLKQLCLNLEEGIINKSEQLVAVLDRALDQCRQAQEYSYQIYTCTDSGPARSNNEDAAYPPSGTLVEVTQTDTSLAIVCDGVGGHEGGEIAAQTTINYLRDRVAQLSFAPENSYPNAILQQLAKFTNAANDVISKRNDSEQRQERQRMGTTLVMTLAHAHEVYLAHVGDSRIYWITPTGCHQVTIDDDLASREVRLGYAIYREALHYPSAGALIQALGMRESSALHPNLQRLVIDEDCVFLLCSDGLSDLDRVEQYWRITILPVLEQRANLTGAVKSLIKIANERNGHDNVTVALVHCRVKPKQGTSEPLISWSDVESVLNQKNQWITTESDTESLSTTGPNTESSENSKVSTRSTESKTNSKSLIPLTLFLLGLIVLLGMGILFLRLINSNQLPLLPRHQQEEVAPLSNEEKQNPSGEVNENNQ